MHVKVFDGKPTILRDLRLTTGIIKGGIKVFEKQQTKPPVSLKVWLSKGPWPRKDLGNPWDTADLAGGFNFFPANKKALS